MRRTVRLTERDLSRIVRRVIKEDQERFTLQNIKDGSCGDNGEWRVENGGLILVDCNIDGFVVDVQVVEEI
jgi:hypothetical protein